MDPLVELLRKNSRLYFGPAEALAQIGDSRALPHLKEIVTGNEMKTPNGAKPVHAATQAIEWIRGKHTGKRTGE